VSGCLHATPVDNLPILADIQPAELHYKRATLSLVHRAMEPGHLLHGEWLENTQDSGFSSIDIGAHPPGMALRRTAWVRHNRLHTCVGRFRSCLYKWDMAASAARGCGAEEQTVDHVVLHCPIHRSPHGVHETIEWLLNICPEI